MLSRQNVIQSKCCLGKMLSRQKVSRQKCARLTCTKQNVTEPNKQTRKLRIILSTGPIFKANCTAHIQTMQVKR